MELNQEATVKLLYVNDLCASASAPDPALAPLFRFLPLPLAGWSADPHPLGH